MHNKIALGLLYGIKGGKVYYPDYSSVKSVTYEYSGKPYGYEYTIEHSGLIEVDTDRYGGEINLIATLPDGTQITASSSALSNRQMFPKGTKLKITRTVSGFSLGFTLHYYSTWIEIPEASGNF